MNKIKLKIKWSKKEEGFVINYPSRPDAHWANWFFLADRKELVLKTNPPAHISAGAKVEEMEWKWNDASIHFKDRVYQEISYNLVEQLIDRGFDPKTLKIEVSIDPLKLESQFPHIYNNLSEEEKRKLALA